VLIPSRIPHHRTRPNEKSYDCVTELPFRVRRSRLGRGWQEQDLLQHLPCMGEWGEQHVEIGFLAGRPTALHKAIGEQLCACEFGEGVAHEHVDLLPHHNRILVGVGARPIGAAGGPHALSVPRPGIGAAFLARCLVEIAENTKHATEMAVEFALGVLNSVLTLVSFIGILWTLSGVLDIALGTMDLKIPGYMVFAALLYAGVGSGLTYLVGRPIVAANIRQNATEADYRFALVRLRENSEAVALIRGEADEEKGLSRYFGDVLVATMGLMCTQRRLMWLTSFYASVGMVYPTLVASPRFFAGAITLGVLMQITAAFGQVQTSLNWFVDNFPRLAEWRSHVERLLEFEEALDTTGESTSEAGEVTTIALSDCTGANGEQELSFRDLQITHADGNIVISDANTDIRKGEKVLIVGPSGSGKSMLFRAIAGLWPWGKGQIVVPDRSGMMFMPQRPYLPMGTLGAVLSYPASESKFPPATVSAALERCG
jgi:vitamin B12/bleomycin/antimicrobial peptide transport system ATP-binding/permease protein